MIRPGDIVDRYLVEGLLGQGGAASVWAARHRILGTRHALKVLHGGARELGDRLVREGQVQARLDPTHIVPVTDVIEVDGSPALVLPLVEGGPLAEVVRGPLPTRETATLLAGIAAGLAAAHGAGVVHRDLKPANVLLELRTDRVVPRISDFGLARLLSQPSGTRQGVFLGTPAWAAPEQLRGEPAGPPADLWALGVVAYELLTGRLPFLADDLAGLRRAQERPYDRAAAPAEWRSALDRLLEPDPGRRPEAAALDEVLRDLGADPSALGEGSELLHRVRRSGARVPTQPADALGEAPPPDQTGRTIAIDSGGASSALPAERDSFVGRQELLAEIGRRLQEEARLVTLLGIGGAGKSRVALRYARTSGRSWPGGVWFCDLAAATDADGVVRAVADELGVALDGAGAREQLADTMAHRGRCLVLLDNFEHLTAAAPQTVGRWLDRAPEARFLVTSREPLGLAGEAWLPLDPLGSVEGLQLFLRRAEAVRPGFDPSPADLEALRELIALLDGLPLAIELAAARVAVLSPRHLRDRMVDRFRLLVSTAARPARQATLRAALDGSWELLTEAERSGLAQLSVLEGPFTLEAASDVVRTSVWPEDVVQGLIARSLVRRAGDRFSLLASVRAYAQERLRERGPEEVRSAELRHAEHFAFGPEDPTRPDLADLAAAVRRSVGSEPRVAAAAAVRLWQVLHYRGPLDLGAELLSAAYHRDPDNAPAALIRYTAQALQAIGRAAEAKHLFELAAARARAEGDRELESGIANDQALALADQGLLAEAVATLEAKLRQNRERGDRVGQATALANLGVYRAQAGDLPGGRARMEEALTVLAGMDDPNVEGSILLNLGASYHLEDPARAWALLERSVEVLRSAGISRMESLALGNLGTLAVEQGDAERAQELLDRSVTVGAGTGDPHVHGLALIERGGLWLHLGRWAEARRDLDAGEALVRRGGDVLAIAKAIARQARLELAAGDRARGEALLREAEGSIARVGCGPGAPAWQEVDKARRELG